MRHHPIMAELSPIVANQVSNHRIQVTLVPWLFNYTLPKLYERVTIGNRQFVVRSTFMYDADKWVKVHG